MGRMFLRTALATPLGIGLHLGTRSPALAQGVPVVDTQNIAQNIQQLRQNFVGCTMQPSTRAWRL